MNNKDNKNDEKKREIKVWNDTEVKLLKIVKQKSKLILNIRINNKIKKFSINKYFKNYVVNILSAIAVISDFIDVRNLKKNIFYNFKPLNSRGDFTKVRIDGKTINVVDESYNSNPLSLEFAINNFDKIKISPKRKYILLADMLELGKFSKKLHKQAAKTLNKSNINKVYVYGKYIRGTFNKIQTQKQGKILKNKKEIFKLMKNDLKHNDYLMAKGSNSTGLNTIISKIKLGRSNAL